jgi:ABC-2 type transport system permease protein/oleandomycin transport system permease protein
MSATAISLDLERLVEERGRGGLSYGLADVVNIARRNLIKSVRNPQVIVFTTIQPVMLLLLFTYVFGGVVRIPDYVEYLVPAILIQTTSFASMGTGVGLATDLQEGIFDRFRSLPIARGAVLAGRTLADLVRMAFQLVLMLIVAYIVGFRFRAGVLPALGSCGIALLFGFTWSWIAAALGLAVKDPEAAQAAMFVWVFPVTFVSSAFAPVNTLKGFLQPFARINPITSTADAMRALATGGPTFTFVWHTVAWMGAILLVFTTLSVRTYRRAV